MIGLYMDENVQDAITEGLRLRGVDVLSVREDGYGGRDDSAVFQRAHSLGRVLFSRDSDMIVEAIRCQESNTEFTGLIYARQNVLSVGQCIADLEYLALAGEDSDFANQIRYLPL
jgi:hypothetical protein